jgi:hypothetical protein
MNTRKRSFLHGFQYVNGWLDELAPKIDRDDPIAYNEL